MENAINTLRIQNFKSIKDVTMHPRRVNLIIGMPNVGKSNILEAMSLLGGMFFDKEGEKFMEGQVRYEDIRNIFYDNDWNREIRIVTNIGGAWAKKAGSEVAVAYANDKAMKAKPSANSLQGVYLFVEKYSKNLNYVKNDIGYNKAENDYKSMSWFVNDIGNDGRRLEKDISNRKIFNVPKKYNFSKRITVDNSYSDSYLYPPFGDNMVDVLQNGSDILRRGVSDLFRPYGLNFAVRVADRKFEIQKNIDGYIYDYPYSLIADTLQRMIFYLAAIESNNDSVLLFEEPEAHTFPVYTSMLGRKIAASHNNQFFIATHSPYLVTEILEQMLPEEGQEGELAIFLAYYEDYQTKVKQLSNEEIREIRNDSIDVFYNLSRFTPGSNSYA